MMYSIDGGIITTLCNIGTLVTVSEKHTVFHSARLLDKHLTVRDTDKQLCLHGDLLRLL